MLAFDACAKFLLFIPTDIDAAPRNLASNGTVMSEISVGVATVFLHWRSPRDYPESLVGSSVINVFFLAFHFVGRQI